MSKPLDIAALAPSVLILYFFLLFAVPSTGTVDKIVLPEGMQSVDFYGCSGLSGTAEIGDD
jgi:hypothetical protein